MFFFRVRDIKKNVKRAFLFFYFPFAVLKLVFFGLVISSPRVNDSKLDVQTKRRRNLPSQSP